MRYLEFLGMVLHSIFLELPLKGIIYAEEQFVLWHIVLGGTLFEQMIPGIVIFVVCIILIRMVVFNREPRFNGHHHILGNALNFIWRFLVVFLLSWAFLLYGVIAGNMAEAQRNATISYTYRRRYGALDAVNNFTRLSLHFRLGRGLYNVIYRLIGHITFISSNARAHRIVTLVIALTICLWGVWNIPSDLMN